MFIVSVIVADEFQKLSLIDEKLYMVKGEKYNLANTISNKTLNIKYESYDSNIVMVDSEGEILAVDTGETKIKVSTYNGKSTVYYVKVEDKLEDNEQKNNYSFISRIKNALEDKNKIIKFYRREDVIFQDIATYKGRIFRFSEGKMYIDGLFFPIENGHGNNCMFGTKIFGDYPYLYCGSWLKDNCKVYVNKITEDGVSLIDIIPFDSLKGYLNCCIDDQNKYVYILLNTSDTTIEGDVDFIISDFYGDIIFENNIGKLPVIQGMTFYDGYIFVTSGLGTIDYPNKISVFDTLGKLIYENSDLGIEEEIEGIDITNDEIFLSTIHSFYRVELD